MTFSAASGPHDPLVYGSAGGGFSSIAGENLPALVEISSPDSGDVPCAALNCGRRPGGLPALLRVVPCAARGLSAGVRVLAGLKLSLGRSSPGAGLVFRWCCRPTLRRCARWGVP